MNKLFTFLVPIFLLITAIALIRPRVFGSKNNPTPSRWKLSGVTLALMIGSFVGYVATSDKMTAKQTKIAAQTTAEKSEKNKDVASVAAPELQKKALKPSQSAIDYIQIAIMDDITSALSDKKETTLTLVDAMKIAGIDYKITAAKYDKEFDENEVAAQKKYKGKTIIVSGKIKDFGTDLFGNPFITLIGSDQFIGVSAGFPKGQTDHIALLKKGQQVDLICKGAAKVMGASLSDCLPLSAWQSTKNKQVRTYLLDGLGGKSEIDETVAMIAGAISLRIDQIQKTEGCSLDLAPDAFLGKCLEPVFKVKLTDEERQQIDDFQKTLIIKKRPQEKKRLDR